MPKSRTRKRKPAPRHPETPRPVLGAEEEIVLARSLRRSCDYCGSSHLHWGDVAAGAFSAPLDEQRAAFTEAVAAGFPTSATAWWCMSCDNLGIFEPSQLLWG